MKKVYLSAVGLILGIVCFAVLVGSLVRCASPEQYSENAPHEWKAVVVKKKYSENQVTKDIVFGTGNWHSVEHFIVDNNNKVWRGISQDDFIICDVGDTLWTDNDYTLQLKK